jgi:TonB family protein
MKKNLMFFLAIFFILASTSMAYDMFEELKKASKSAKREAENGGIIGKCGNCVSSEGRSREEVMQVVEVNTPTLKSLYNEYLKQKPGFSGKVILKFTIAATGEIIKINIISSTTGYVEFDKAIRDEVATWKWKAFEGGNTTPTIPFNFTEEESWSI